MPLQPQVFVIAGPNGAGKTTFALRFLRDYARCANFVNPDLIAAGLSPLHPESAAAAAGRLVLQEIQRLANARANFAFETTLSGKTYAALLHQLRNRGYRVWIFYLWLPAPELSLVRIEARVRSGGHSVPEADARRRYLRSLHNFFSVYRHLADVWHIFDNSGSQLRLIARREGEDTLILEQEAFAALERLAE